MLGTLRLVIVPLLPARAPEYQFEDRGALRRLLAVCDAPDVVREVFPTVENRLCRLVRRRQDLGGTRQRVKTTKQKRITDVYVEPVERERAFLLCYEHKKFLGLLR